jgi:hypothetical protein
MSYNVMSEADGRIDWKGLNAVVSPLRGAVEVFPIPGDGDGIPDAVGLSVPRDHANDAGWEELLRLVNALRERFSMKSYELYSGLQFAPSTLEKIRLNCSG